MLRRRLKTGAIFLGYSLVYGIVCGLLGWSLNVNGRATITYSNVYGVLVSGIGAITCLATFLGLTTTIWTSRRRHRHPAPVPAPAAPPAAEA